jgi:hypothetical protein
MDRPSNGVKECCSAGLLRAVFSKDRSWEGARINSGIIQEALEPSILLV